MSDWISLLNGAMVSIFGCVLAASFCGTLDSTRKRLVFCGGVVLLLLLQGVCYSIWDAEVLRQLYPLVVHVPLVLFLYFLTRKVVWPTVSVLTAYLCCQLRRWLALLVVALASGGQMLQDIVELVATIPLLLILMSTVSPVVRRMADQPMRFQFQFGIIPALYYLFDYIAVVYTDLLMQGPSVVVEFMPFVCCIFYLFFLIHNSATERKNNRMQQIQKNLDLQLRQSVREISALQESQDAARQYRHDLRHHLRYVSNCIENGQGEQAQEYISEICKEIDAQKVEQYCENEPANLILSAFVGQAKSVGVAIHIEGVLPADMKVSNSDLCVLFSNSLENALHACQTLAAEGEKCTIDVNFYEWDGNFFLQVTNPCKENVRFENGIPVSDRAGHGVGVQSICEIVKRYRGVCTFLVEDGQFIMRLSV